VSAGHLDQIPPAAQLLGREVLGETGDGALRLRYTARPEFLNRHGTVQGGFLSAMLDSATSAVLFAVLPPERTSVTMSLETQFLKPARLGSFVATARIVSRDEREATTEAELADADGAVVAKGRARLRILKRP
jgi:uncharacterized protein (TIGR00369 family)